MDLQPQFWPPYPPYLHISSLPESEQKVGESIADHLRIMESQSKNLSAAIALFEYSKQDPSSKLFRCWTFIAARQGVLALRNYIYSMEAVRGLIGQVPGWLSIVDTRIMKESYLQFDERFPRIVNFRHAIAHPEYYADPSKDMTNHEDYSEMISMPAGGTIQESLENSTFVSTIDGGAVRYDVTFETSGFVSNLTRQFFNAFSALDPLYQHMQKGQ